MSQASNASDPTAKILVVDDEPTVRQMIGINLRSAGMEVVPVATGIEALDRVIEARPDAVVLDIMLPGIDGFEVCRRIREHSTVPILLLSARGEEIDRVMGLEIGADDYLTKPFAMRELVARVRAMLRRAKFQAVEPAAPPARTAPVEVANHVVAAGNLLLDPERRTATMAGEPLALKPKEFDLLLYLMRHPGIVLTRDALLREVWGYDFPIDTRTVDVHIRWLRSKVERDPSAPVMIETVRGYGYRFADPDGRQGA